MLLLFPVCLRGVRQSGPLFILLQFLISCSLYVVTLLLVPCYTDQHTHTTRTRPSSSSYPFFFICQAGTFLLEAILN